MWGFHAHTYTFMHIVVPYKYATICSVFKFMSIDFYMNQYHIYTFTYFTVIAILKLTMKYLIFIRAHA